MLLEELTVLAEMIAKNVHEVWADRHTALETLRLITKLGFRIETPKS